MNFLKRQGRLVKHKLTPTCQQLAQSSRCSRSAETTVKNIGDARHRCRVCWSANLQENPMQRSWIGAIGLGAALAIASPVGAQEPVKIGLILPYSGQFADTASQMDNAIKLYVKQHGDSVAGRKLEFIRKDT